MDKKKIALSGKSDPSDLSDNAILFANMILLYVINPFKQAAPTYATETTTVGVARPPYEQWLAHDVVFGHKTPITAVRRVVSVVALHPIVVEFEGVRRCGLVVNVNLSLLYFELVALVNLNATLVDRLSNVSAMLLPFAGIHTGP